MGTQAQHAPLTRPRARPLKPPDVAIDHVSSFLQYWNGARLLKVAKSTKEIVFAGDTVLVFTEEAAGAAVIAMVTKFHSLKLANLASCSEVTDAGV